MNFVHDSFLDELTDDYICPNKITVENKFCLVKTLIVSMEHVLELIRIHAEAPSDHHPTNRLIWLIKTRGDLADRTDREAFMMDSEQYRQVFEFLEHMLCIHFTESERASPVVFENAWRFYRSFEVTYRRFVHPDNSCLQPKLDALWDRYDSLVDEAKRALDPLPEAWAAKFEDCFFERGLATAKNDVRNAQKCMEPYARKTYSFLRGEERFQKLFKFHGQRPELLEQYSLFKDLMAEYIPLYLLETKRKLDAAGPKGFVPHRERMEETMRNASVYLEQARNLYVSTERQKLVFDEVVKSIGI
jgi:hypothetical protein